MNCTETQDLLSAFYDGQLPDDVHAQVAQHVAQCDRCAEELAAFESLSRLAAEMADPDPPAAIWEQLEEGLEAPAPSPTASAPRAGRRSILRWLVLAATVLIAVGLGWWGFHDRHGDHHDMATVFHRYLKRFETSPDEAQQMLLSMYKGQAVAPDQAVRLVGYRPATANPLPEGYQSPTTYVLKMPCCTCLQTVCRRADGSAIAIFEHDDANAEWLEGLPMEMTGCGTQCLCKVNNRLAARLQQGNRYITMVGVRDKEELATLVTWLKQSSAGESG